MRTTIDLEPDVNARLRELAHERGVSLKHLINETLRAAASATPVSRERYVVPTHPLGIRPGINIDKALALAAELEDEEILHKMQLGK